MGESKSTRYKIPVGVVEKMRKTQRSLRSRLAVLAWPLLVPVMAFVLAGVFLFFLKLTKHFLMGSVSWGGVPWLYISLYMLSIAFLYALVFVVRKGIQRMKRKRALY